MKHLTRLMLFVQLVERSYAWLDAANVTSLDLADSSPERRCISFPTCLLDPHALINKATYRPAQTLFDLRQVWLNTSTLPGFCQLELSITTNPVTGRTAGAELWLPDEWDWNGRILATGSYSALAFDGIQQGYASYTSHGGVINGGHSCKCTFPSTAFFYSCKFGMRVRYHLVAFNEDLERMAKNPENDEELIDYSWRALHSTTVHAKALVESYYEQRWTKSYFSGCGGSGRQGIKAMATFPEDYDGLLLGSPENPLSDVIPWRLQLARLVDELKWISQPGFWFPREAQPSYKRRMMVHAEVLKQCDGLDGVLDGVISFPEDCHFCPEVLVCRPDFKPWPCLTLSALDSLKRLHTPLLDAEQNHVFSPLMPGAEYWINDPPDDGVVAWRWPADYYRRFISNSGWIEDSFVAPSGTVANIDRTFNPAEIDTYTPDLTAFFKRGGKVLQYAGWDDDRVSPGNSIKWYQDVFAYTLTESGLNPEDHFRLFMVPGMKHCTASLHLDNIWYQNSRLRISILPRREGNGAWLFGGHDQRSKTYFPDEVPWDGTCFITPRKKNYRYMHHLRDYAKRQTGPVDAQAALADWVEKGVPVDHLIATKYDAAPDQLSVTVDYTRKLCPWPQRAIYLGGDESSHASFECR